MVNDELRLLASTTITGAVVMKWRCLTLFFAWTLTLTTLDSDFRFSPFLLRVLGRQAGTRSWSWPQFWSWPWSWPRFWFWSWSWTRFSSWPLSWTWPRSWSPAWPPVCVCVFQSADGSDEDEEGKALMIKPGVPSAKEEKDNEAFFRKVTSQHSKFSRWLFFSGKQHEIH